MNVHNVNEENIIEAIVVTLEANAGRKLFTMRVLENEADEREPQQIDIIAVFEDRSVLKGVISIETKDGEIGCRLKANYI